MASENGATEPIGSALHMGLVLTVKPENVLLDSFAVGACLQDLRREGWVLTRFTADPSVGVVAELHRGWKVEAVKPPEQAKPRLVVADELP